MLRVFVVFLVLFSGRVEGAPLPLKVQAEAAIVMNADTGAILYAKNIHKKMVPASTTKIATLLYALKRVKNLDEVITVDNEAVVSVTAAAKRKSNWTLAPYYQEPDGTHMGLKTGEQLSLRDLMLGMMLVSGNDAANQIAIHIDKTVPAFMGNLNAYLKEIGCQNTQLWNPSGIYFPKHQTTAYDLALMAKEAVKDPLYVQIAGTVQHLRPKTNKNEPTMLVNSNKLLRKGPLYYDKLLFGKTGRLNIAGNCFVSAGREDGRTLIVVLLKTEDRTEMFQDAIKAYKLAFGEKRIEKTLLEKGVQKFTLAVEGYPEPIEAALPEDLKIAYYPSEEPTMKCMLTWDNVNLPLEKDQKIGTVKLIDADKKVLVEVPVVSNQAVKPTWGYSIRRFFGSF